jgi:hypothetical protein
MGFVENAPASASVIAQDDLLVDVIGEAALLSVLSSTPGFAVRFYHSLAHSLSLRLRATSRRVSQSVLERGVVSRVNPVRTGNITPRQIPMEMQAALDTFEQDTFELDQALRKGRIDESSAQERLSAVCDQVLRVLDRVTQSQPLVEIGWDDLLSFRDLDHIEAGIGDYVFRETFRILMLSATIARCYAKSRGFSEDYETTLTIYRDDAEGDGHLGPFVDRWFLNRPLCRSRRASRDLMQLTLSQFVSQWTGALMRVTSLASGAASELIDLVRSEGGQQVMATCIDLDPEALLTVAQRAQHEGIGDRVTVQEGSAVPAHENGIELIPQHVIYALGLFEYLTDEQVVAVLDWSLDHLTPDGAIVVTNLNSINPDRALMVHLLDWKVNHRSSEQLRSLFARSHIGTGSLRIFTEETGINDFAICVKSSSG